MRLFWLHLRSRPLAEAGIGLAAIALTTWLLLETTSNSIVVRLVTVAIPLVVACVVVWSARSPFGEGEKAIGSLLPRLRLGQLGLVLLVALVALAVANALVSERDTTGEVVRNIAGYTGLAFLGGRLLGGAGTWAVPLAVGCAAYLNDIRHPDDPAWWAWPIHPDSDGRALLAALALLLIGMAAMAYEARGRVLAVATVDRV